MLNKPKFPEWLSSYLLAFQKLSITRDYSAADGKPLPIKLSEMKAYLDIFPGHDDIAMFIEVMTRVDMEYRKAVK